jgi:hypothetical protein
MQPTTGKKARNIVTRISHSSKITPVTVLAFMDARHSAEVAEISLDRSCSIPVAPETT